MKITSGINPGEVEKFITENLELALAGDVANFSKHTKLRTTRTGDKSTRASNTYYAYNVDTGPTYVKSAVYITSKGVSYDALVVAGRCMDLWHGFLLKNSMEIPEIMEETIYRHFKKWTPDIFGG